MKKVKSFLIFILIFSILFEFSLSKASATTTYLNLATSPSGAVVYLNGQPTSYITPCTITGLTSGLTYELRLEKSGYAPLVQVFVAGTSFPPLLTLAPAVSTSFMKFETFPIDVAVYLKDLTGIALPRLIGIAPCTLSGLTPGVAYTIIFEKVGYVTETASLKAVAGGSTQTMSLRLPAVSPSLRLTSLPSGATVYVNGVKQASLTPCTLENLIIARIYTLRFEKTGYTPHEEGFMPKDGINFLAVKLAPLVKTTFDIILTSFPSGAYVAVYGEAVSAHPWLVATPYTLKNVVPGTHYTFTFSKPGYISQTVQSTASSASPKVAVTLEKVLTINITSAPSGATVYVNAVKQPKLTPCTIENSIIVRIGAVLNIAIKKAGYQPFYQTFSTWKGGPSNISTKLVIIPGIYLTSTPAGAAVYLDGATTSNYTTPCTLTTFAVGTLHNLRLVAPGYAPVTKTVRMPAGHLPVLVYLAKIKQAVVTITSYPAGAQVLVNKAPSGLTPVKMYILPLQTLVLVVQKTGYVSQTKTIALTNGGSYYWTVRLQKKP